MAYRSEDRQLHVYVNAPTQSDAQYTPGTGAITLSKGLSAPDPDTLAHEQGHAIMDAVRPGITSRDNRTVAASEGFADSVALIHALDSKDVRADALRNWARGENSTLASNIGEATHAGLPGWPKTRLPQLAKASAT